MATNIKQLTPSIAIHPGEVLKDELKDREINQREFALLTGIPHTQLNEIIKGKRGINADIALIISKALKMDAEIWQTLQGNYELDLAKVSGKNTIRLAALDQWEMVKAYVPEKYYKKHNVLTGNPVLDVPVVKDIYGVQNFEQLAGVYSHTSYARFRKSDKLSIDKVNLVGWVKLVNYQAAAIKVENFDVGKQADLIGELKAIFNKNKKTVEKTTQVLARFGIKLIVQPHPEKCAVDGISFWSEGNPAIGISLRHKRIDNFAFTILHELGHVFLHLINDITAQFIDLDREHNSPSYKNSKEEIEANNFSRNCLIDQPSWDAFVNDNPDFIEDAVKQFANKMKVHPAIVQGRFCFEQDFFRVRSNIDRKLL